MTQTPICEHCDNPLTEIYVKSTVFYTYIPDINEYMNTEKNWDSEGNSWNECPHCGKETDMVTWNDDGRLIPTPTTEEQVNDKLKELSGAIRDLKPKELTTARIKRRYNLELAADGEHPSDCDCKECKRQF